MCSREVVGLVDIKDVQSDLFYIQEIQTLFTKKSKKMEQILLYNI